MDDMAGADGAEQTRRDLLKKAGVAAGVVWTAPIVMSSFSAAAAASGDGCADSVCGTATICGTGGFDDLCGCFSTADQGPMCLANFPCVGTPECNTSADCGPGLVCVVNTCCTPTQLAGFCVGACPNPAPGLSIEDVAPGAGSEPNALGV